MADAYKWGKDIDFKLDNAAGTLTDLTAHVPNAAIRNAIDILDITSVGVSGPEVQHGIANVTIPINFFVNSTTEGIFGPLLNRTSLEKTAAFYNGIRWYTGEFFPSNVEFSGDAKSLIMGSCDLTIDGTITRTSTEPS